MNALWAGARTGNRLAVVDLIAYVVLAFGIGLATAVALGGVVLLLAHDAQAAAAVQQAAQPDAAGSGWDILSGGLTLLLAGGLIVSARHRPAAREITK